MAVLNLLRCYLGGRSIGASYMRGLVPAMELGAYGWQQKIGDHVLYKLSAAQSADYAYFLKNNVVVNTFTLQNGFGSNLPTFIPTFGPLKAPSWRLIP